MDRSSHDVQCCYPHYDIVLKLFRSFLRSSGCSSFGSFDKLQARSSDRNSWKAAWASKTYARKESTASTCCDSAEGDALSSNFSSEDEDVDFVTQIRQTDLDRAFADIGRMRQWEHSLWKAEKTLSTACGSHGRVDRMRRRRACGLRDGNGIMEDRVAVKSVPTRWLTTSPLEFQRAHPAAIEFPWQDLCVLKHLNTLGFPYAVQLHGIFVGNKTAYIMTSLAAEGDLFAWCSKEHRRPGIEREAAMRPLARQIFEGVRWLHDLGVAHRDLSLENTLLADSGDVKIIDFGMATLKPRRCRGLRGKPSYQAPEMHELPTYDGFLSDAFAVGVMLFGMASAKYPWRSTKPGSCPAYSLMKSRGLRSLLRLRAFQNEEDGLLLSEAVSMPFELLLQGLLATNTSARMTLGEDCYEHEARDVRHSVWDSEWWKEDEVEALNFVLLPT